LTFFSFLSFATLGCLNLLLCTDAERFLSTTDRCRFFFVADLSLLEGAGDAEWLRAMLSDTCVPAESDVMVKLT